MTERAPDPNRLSDGQLLEFALIEARATDTPISDGAARMIAYRLNGEHIHHFAETGELMQGIGDELASALREASFQDQLFIGYLGQYYMNREDRGAVEGWEHVWLKSPSEY